MASVQQFEELNVWQKARALNLKIYKVSDKGNFAKDYALKDQARRASISIVSNIAEGFERNGNREFIQFLSVAKSSAAELRAQSYLMLDLNYVSTEEFKIIYDELIEIGKMLNGFMEYLKNSEIKGGKFKEDPAIYEL